MSGLIRPNAIKYVSYEGFQDDLEQAHCIPMSNYGFNTCGEKVCKVNPDADTHSHPIQPRWRDLFS